MGNFLKFSCLYCCCRKTTLKELNNLRRQIISTVELCFLKCQISIDIELYKEILELVFEKRNCEFLEDKIIIEVAYTYGSYEIINLLFENLNNIINKNKNNATKTTTTNFESYTMSLMDNKLSFSSIPYLFSNKKHGITLIQPENFKNQDRLEILLKCLNLYGEPKEQQQSELLLLEQNEGDEIQKILFEYSLRYCIPSILKQMDFTFDPQKHYQLGCCPDPYEYKPKNLNRSL
ncbi:hypothetical protein ACTFIY_009874 [Dictyostelium cf. discoideum]